MKQKNHLSPGQKAKYENLARIVENPENELGKYLIRQILGSALPRKSRRRKKQHLKVDSGVGAELDSSNTEQNFPDECLENNNESEICEENTGGNGTCDEMSDSNVKKPVVLSEIDFMKLSSSREFSHVLKYFTSECWNQIQGMLNFFEIFVNKNISLKLDQNLVEILSENNLNSSFEGSNPLEYEIDFNRAESKDRRNIFVFTCTRKKK